MRYWVEQDDWGNWYAVSDKESIPFEDDREGAEEYCILKTHKYVSEFEITEGE